MLRATILAGCSLLFAIIVGATSRVGAQPVVVAFQPIPCDSTACDTLSITNPDSKNPSQIISVRFRDAQSFTASGVTLPVQLAPSERYNLVICITPQRKGNITDSLYIVLKTSAGNDTVAARLTGRGLGPALDAVPNVMNFPKTNPGSNTLRTMVIRNVGELPYTLDASALVVPPPFILVTPLPLLIAPKDSVTITVMFKPDSNGIYSRQVNLPSGCHTVVQLGFNGSTDLIGTGAVIRISKTGFNPANNEQIPCDSLRCTTLTFSNVGNAPLIIENIAWQIGTLGYTITNPIPTPFIIPPQDSRDVDVCITSHTRGVLRDTLVVTSNSRSSIAFGLVIDISGSMKGTMLCNGQPSTRMAQAITQSRSFIAKTLLYLPAIGIVDQLLVTSFTTASLGFPNLINDIFKLQYINDASRLTAENAVSALAPIGGTPTGAALQHVLDVISTSPLQNRVIVLVTDGEATDTLQYPVAQVAARARSLGIRVFTIGIGLDPAKWGRAYLKTLSNGTNAKQYDVSDNDCSTLQTAFDDITDLLSRGAKNYEPFQIKILSPYVVTLQDMVFDSVYVHGTTCRVLTLTNAGEGNAVVDSATFQDMLGGPTSEFTFSPGTRFPIIIPENSQAQVTICFTPNQIRMRNGQTTFYYNSCGQVPVSAKLTGPAFAEANLRLTDERIGLPGQTVTLPVYCDSSLSTYSVNTITYKVRWNKTMLDLRGVRPGANAGGATLNLTAPIDYGTHYATAEVTAQGNNLPGTGELAQLDFMVLRGDSLGSTVELTAGNFEDNNPKTHLANAGMIAFDSVCFRDFKPITFGNVAKIMVGDVTPTPASGHALKIDVTSDQAATISVQIYAADGTLASGANEYALHPGMSTLQIDIANGASGTYYLLLHLPDGSVILRKLVIAR